MDFYSILAKFADKFSYIEDISGVVKFLKDNKVDKTRTNELLYEIIKHNNDVERNALRKLTKQTSLQKESTATIKNILDTPSNKSLEEDVIPHVTHYLKSLSECEDGDFMTEILPSIYDTNYEEIMMAILISLFNEIAYANKLLKESTTTDEIRYLEKEIKKYSNIINVVKSYNQDEQEEKLDDMMTIDTTTPYKFVYLLKPDGTSYVCDDIDEINEEDYDVTKNLIEKLMARKTTKEKRFANLEDLKGLSAVRRQDSRIVFQRLDNNTILILGIFTKRCQNTTVYRDFIRKRAKIKDLQKENLTTMLENNSFLDYSSKITDDIINRLRKKENLVKRKYQNE